MKTSPRPYRGTNADVTYDVRRCIHAAECVRGLPSVFNRSHTPWIVVDNEPIERVREVVLRCPSGALHIVEKSGEVVELPSDANRIVVVPDGPLHARGDFILSVERTGEELADTRMALCRCGHSRNKPLCDESHRGVEFDDEGVATVVADVEVESASGRADIVASANGPLVIVGRVEVRDATGAIVFRGDGVELCRCGHSSHKPFCDRSHLRVGFTDAPPETAK